MTTFELRQRLVEIARRDVGQVESSRNRGEWIRKFWPATTYPEGYQDRAAYCAAAVAYWIQEWLKDPEVCKALGKTPQEARNWRCKSAAAFGWRDWAHKKGLVVMDDKMTHTLHKGDLMVFDCSHIGVIVTDHEEWVHTIEANTGNQSTRDGDGCWEKVRHRSAALCFVRLLA
jgi:hypothetical protein